MTVQTVWIMAGEPSGDAYGARLAAELFRLRPGLRIEGMGGEAMRQAGVDILVDSTDLAVVGLAEVLRNLPFFRRIFLRLRRQATARRPATVVLIDYPGFNLRFAAAMKQAGIPTVYYVSPQVWAWGRRRIGKLARWVRKMLVLFPFELDVFAGTGLDVEFVGHPLVEILRGQRQPETTRENNTVLLLPGSRDQEIKRLLPDMLAAARLLQKRRPELRFVISLHSERLTPSVQAVLNKAEGQRQTGPAPALETVSGQTRQWLQRATAGIAASGTVTMEAAIMGLPLTVVYRVHPLTYWLGRWLVNVPFLTMPNLVAGECVYEEFVQQQCRPAAVAGSLEKILPGGEREQTVRQAMHRTVELLGTEGGTGRRTAQAVLQVADEIRS